MKNLRKAKILINMFYDEDYSPTDDNIMDCYRWLLCAAVTKENAKDAISAETGIILRDEEL